MNKLFMAIKERFQASLGMTYQNTDNWMGLNEEEQRQFSEWAFGADIKKTANAIPFVFNAWNSRHGDLFELKKEDLVSESCKKMVILWRESKKVI